MFKLSATAVLMLAPAILGMEAALVAGRTPADSGQIGQEVQDVLSLTSQAPVLQQKDPPISGGDKEALARKEMIRHTIQALLKTQEKGGRWLYGNTVEGIISAEPLGVTVGSTAIVASALLHAARDDKEARAAIDRALVYLFKSLKDPRMAPTEVKAKPGVIDSETFVAKNRIWGNAAALELFCHIRAYKAAGDYAKDLDDTIKKLIDMVVADRLKDGGWDYSDFSFVKVAPRHSPFCTTFVVQSLLCAHGQGFPVPREVLEQARAAIESCRMPDLGYTYGGAQKDAKNKDNILPGSVSRTVAGETTLVLLGSGSIDNVRKSIDLFHKYWENLEKYRGTAFKHNPPYGVAPYYFYYGHRYCAQAIQLLPEKERSAERAKLMKLVLREEIRDKDGMWNDRDYKKSRSYGTAVVLLMLLDDQVPLPARLEKSKEKAKEGVR